MDCCCCCCFKSEEERNEEYEVYMVEDGDELQNFGVRHTLELLRRMMNQNGRPIADQPPPAYAEFDKYPLATDEDQPVMAKSAPQPACFENTLNQTTAPCPSPLTYEMATSWPASVSPSSRPSTWIEPFPKPPGEPPPVPTNWLHNRIASIRQSLVARFGSRRERQAVTTAVVPSATEPIRTTPARDDDDDGAEVCLTPAQSFTQHESVQSVDSFVPQGFRRSSSTPSCGMSFAIFSQSGRKRTLTMQSSVDTNLSQEHVIFLAQPRLHRKSKSVDDLIQMVEFEPHFTRQNTR
ncbi:hypothetical protein D915_003567 [Fasciola hepatica]|uniref:Uncharacterized protein n=1 Tax=Fasciola hepatica TaxID=6192 RepID=A0A4E0RDV4_FASHE|nr:hypothetical protein D915_003567 [Fasciola hepatica]